MIYTESSTNLDWPY